MTLSCGVGGQFTDIKDIKEEMLTRLVETHFETWLNP
jgi:hypothetical protein